MVKTDFVDNFRSLSHLSGVKGGVRWIQNRFHVIEQSANRLERHTVANDKSKGLCR